MGLRFFRRFRLAPGVTLNVSLSGVSVTLGPPGATVTVGSRGVHGTVGLPGTGLSYTRRLDRRPSRRSAEDEALREAQGLLVGGDEDGAREAFARLSHLPEAAFAAGVLTLRAERGDAAAAERLLRRARSARTLGRRFGELGIDLRLELPLDDDTVATLGPDRLGATLALAEALQRLGRDDEAIRLVRAELARHPGHPTLVASLADLAEER